MTAPHPTPPTPQDAPPRKVTTVFRARYDGGCSTSNEHTIKHGDLIGWTEDDLVVCTVCVEAAAAS